MADYELISSVRGSLGGEPTSLGLRDGCRFCGTKDSTKFRTKAHTVAEALGNKWIISLDECDDCNARFGSYDDALAKSVGPLLTIGGVKGKGNKTRQTGRTSGPNFIRHELRDTGRHISVRIGGPVEDHVSASAGGRFLTFETPTGAERFIPRHAYKALVKTAIALLPDEEIGNFTESSKWIIGVAQDKAVPQSLVGVSFGSVGNAPPLVSMALFRRAETVDSPYMLFVMSVGSVCFQTFLWSDALDDSDIFIRSRSNIKYSNVISAPKKGEIHIEYGDVSYFDWRGSELEPPIVEKIEMVVDRQLGSCVMTPVLRPTAA